MNFFYCIRRLLNNVLLFRLQELGPELVLYDFILNVHNFSGICRLSVLEYLLPRLPEHRVCFVQILSNSSKLDYISY